MIREVADVAPATLAAFDEIIDVRSPGEFAEDHVPGAVNLPVLSDAERAEVGAIYVQRSKLLARRLGAAYVSRNVSEHLLGPLADRDGAYQPLVYCWRGGMRSNAMATVLSQIGWRVGLLGGGYKTYRRAVTDALYEATAPGKLVLLCGTTGSGKTAILDQLQGRGVQTLDLEGLAEHRGSLFGDLPGSAQPPQKLFESRLLAALQRLDPERVIVVEAESSRVGRLSIPPVLWSAMMGAPCIEIVAPLDVRARMTAQTYAHLLAEPDALTPILAALPRHHGREKIAEWLALARAGDGEGFARGLLEAHYDPAYRRNLAARPRERIGAVALDGAGPDALATTAAAIAPLLAEWNGGTASSPPRNL